MNLDLLESFGQSYPEEADGTLDSVSVAITCAFNRRGTLLAVGCNDGRIVIWDFLTRGIAKVISAHVHPVCSLSWNRNGRKILSACTDNVVSVWDVMTGECDHTFRFPSPVLKAQFHPRSDTRFLVCPMKHAAVQMSLKPPGHQIVPLDDDSDLNIVASYDRRGDHIYTGNAKGRVVVYRSDNLEVAASFRVVTGASNATAVKSIEFARRGNCFLVNSADRVIRVYESGEIFACGKNGEPEPIQKLQDLVNKTQWRKCCLSGDGDYIVAGSARQHSLYIWDKDLGNLVKILHGIKGELLLDVVWHPVRPIVCSVAAGVVSVWSQNQVENWSAFAPDFKELDENVEYEERESEFDIEDEDRSVDESKGLDEEDVDVDITTVEPIQAFVSSDEEEEDGTALLYLPVAPEIEDPEECAAPQNDSSQDEQPAKKRSKSKASADESLAFDASLDIGKEDRPRKAKVSVDVNLPSAPLNEIHPLLCPKRSSAQPSSEKQRKPTKSGTSGRSGGKASKHHESKSKGNDSADVLGL